jgi:hypothetical protein
MVKNMLDSLGSWHWADLITNCTNMRIPRMRFLAIRIKNEDVIPMFYTWNPCGYVSDGVDNSGSMPQKKDGQEMMLLPVLNRCAFVSPSRSEWRQAA